MNIWYLLVENRSPSYKDASAICTWQYRKVNFHKRQDNYKSQRQLHTQINLLLFVCMNIDYTWSLFYIKATTMTVTFITIAVATMFKFPLLNKIIISFQKTRGKNIQHAIPITGCFWQIWSNKKYWTGMSVIKQKKIQELGTTILNIQTGCCMWTSVSKS